MIRMPNIHHYVQSFLQYPKFSKSFVSFQNGKTVTATATKWRQWRFGYKCGGWEEKVMQLLK